MSAALIVTVDTEEEGLWSGQFDPAAATVRNVQGIPAFQRICDDLGVAPTYLVNSPVVNDPAAVALLGDIQADGRCEIGTHIHPWNTGEADPQGGGYNARQSYLCNLPLAVQREKLEIVTDEITRAFGVRPRSFRAGRYGLDSAGARLLAEMDYLVDSSVCPYTDYSGDGGPDFRGAPWRPYRVADDLLSPAPDGALLEVPVSFGFNRRHFEAAFRLHEYLQGSALAHLRAIGVLDRLHLLQKIKFSPEKGDAGRLIRLAEAYRANEAPCMVMMFHSSSLQPGHTPYVRNEAELAGFLATLRRVLEHCITELGMKASTLAGFANAYSAGGGAAVS